MRVVLLGNSLSYREFCENSCKLGLSGYCLAVVGVTLFFTIKLTIGALTEMEICGIIIGRLINSQVINIARQQRNAGYGTDWKATF